MEIWEEKETGRIEAFSDGVFAIAITLLVLEIQVPSHETVEVKGLASALGSLWPSYLAYLISFATILVIWVNHHRIFTLVRRSDDAFLFLNGLLLLVVSFIPFPTSVLADYLLHPDAKIAATFFSMTYLVLALAFTLLWRYASNAGRLLGKQISLMNVEQITKQFRVGPPAYTAAVLISFFSAWASVALCLI